MSDTYTQDLAQDVANLDQPAELEDVKLEWEGPKFVETEDGSYYLRTAKATAEFCEVWNRNKAALEAAGICCADQQEDRCAVEWRIDVSTLPDIIPGKNICIPEGKSYTLSEVIDRVQQTLDKVQKKSEHSELQYSSTDVYWLLYDMLRYVNHNVPGVFILGQIEKDKYRVKYMPENFAKQRSDRRLEAEINRTARYLYELTGRKPAWGDTETQEEEETHSEDSPSPTHEE